MTTKMSFQLIDSRAKNLRFRNFDSFSPGAIVSFSRSLLTSSISSFLSSLTGVMLVMSMSWWWSIIIGPIDPWSWKEFRNMKRTPVTIGNPLSRNSSNSNSNNFGGVSVNSVSNKNCAQYLGASSDLYQEVTCLHFLHLHPQYSQNLSLGVMKELNTMLLKYNPDIKGVPLLYSRIELTPAPSTHAIPIPAPSGYPTPISYSNVAVTSAAIIAENPQLQIWIRVRWLAFCPSPGSRVVGSVVKQGPEQINFLLLGLFNATIKRSQLAGTLEWSEEDSSWIIPAHGRRIGLGNLLEFEVLSVKTELNLLRIVGSLDKMQQPAQSKKKTLHG